MLEVIDADASWVEQRGFSAGPADAQKRERAFLYMQI